MYAQQAAGEQAEVVRRQIGDREFDGSILEILDGNSRCGLFLGLDERVRVLIAKLAGLPHFPELRSIRMEFDRKARGRSAHDVGEDGLAIEVWSEGPLPA